MSPQPLADLTDLPPETVQTEPEGRFGGHARPFTPTSWEDVYALLCDVAATQDRIEANLFELAEWKRKADQIIPQVLANAEKNPMLRVIVKPLGALLG